MKNLIYLTVGGNPNYINLTRLMLQSLLKGLDPSLNGGDKYFDVLILTDRKFFELSKAKFQEIANSMPRFAQTIFFFLKEESSPQLISMRKIRVFDFPGIFQYEKALYLDSDIILTGDVRRIFRGVVNPSILYTRAEPKFRNAYSSKYFLYRPYHETEVEFLKKLNVLPFNCGQFAFFLNETFRGHFEVVNRLAECHKGEFFYEQSFMNQYFNLTRFRDDELLGGLVSLDPIADRQREANVLIYHFANASLPGQEKFRLMKLFHDELN